MHNSAITQYIDVAQLVLYAFWIFFAGLIFYLRSEDKREGYPLETDRGGRIRVQGWPPLPKTKTFRMQRGGTVVAPSSKKPEGPFAAESVGGWPGAPLQPTGNPMLDGVGPGSYANRADVADLTFEGLTKIVPLRVAEGFGVASEDADPRGMRVIGGDGKVGGTIVDLWVDRSEMLFRYLEVEAANGRHVLLPMNFTRISGSKRQVTVRSIMGHHFADVPGLKNPDQVTLLEEEKIMAYYGAGTLYAEASRQEPLL